MLKRYYKNDQVWLPGVNDLQLIYKDSDKDIEGYTSNVFSILPIEHAKNVLNTTIVNSNIIITTEDDLKDIILTAEVKNISDTVIHSLEDIIIKSIVPINEPVKAAKTSSKRVVNKTKTKRTKKIQS